jgi:hypothetical protein
VVGGVDHSLCRLSVPILSRKWWVDDKLWRRQCRYGGWKDQIFIPELLFRTVLSQFLVDSRRPGLVLFPWLQRSLWEWTWSCTFGYLLKNSWEILPFRCLDYNQTSLISSHPLAVRVQPLSSFILICRASILGISHNFISLIPPSGHAGHHFSLIFVVSKSKRRVLRSITPAWIWGFRCVYLLPKSIPTIFFRHPSPLPGTPAVFLWDVQHFYSCYI